MIQASRKAFTLGSERQKILSTEGYSPFRDTLMDLIDELSKNRGEDTGELEVSKLPTSSVFA